MAKGIASKPRSQARRSSTPLAQRAYERIKEQILTCQLPPGEMVAAGRLAEGLGMSRTPIHEALKALAAEGLVEVIPRVGYVITQITVKDVQEIFELRLGLETYAVDLAVERAAEADLLAFDRVERETQKATSSLKPGSPKFLLKAVEANRDFHVMIAALSRNGRLIEIVSGLLEESLRMVMMDPLQRLVVDFMASQEHRDVVGAILKKDRQTAKAAIALDIRNAQRRITGSVVDVTSGGGYDDDFGIPATMSR